MITEEATAVAAWKFRQQVVVEVPLARHFGHAIAESLCGHVLSKRDPRKSSMLRAIANGALLFLHCLVPGSLPTQLLRSPPIKGHAAPNKKQRASYQKDTKQTALVIPGTTRRTETGSCAHICCGAYKLANINCPSTITHGSYAPVTNLRCGRQRRRKSLLGRPTPKFLIKVLRCA